jgi:hypothetical protein
LFGSVQHLLGIGATVGPAEPAAVERAPRREVFAHEAVSRGARGVCLRLRCEYEYSSSLHQLCGLHVFFCCVGLNRCRFYSLSHALLLLLLLLLLRQLVDGGGLGIVPLQRLIQCLQSLEFSRVVGSSLALSTIFHGGSFAKKLNPHPHLQSSGGGGTDGSGGAAVDAASGDQDAGKSKSRRGACAPLPISTADIPSLLPVFVDTFSAPTEVEVEVEVEEEVEVTDDERANDVNDVGDDDGEGDEYDNDSFTAVSEEEEEEEEKGGETAAKNTSKVNKKKNNNKKKKTKTVTRRTTVKRPATSEGPDFISKLDFIEFCLAVVDIKRYSTLQ